MRRLVMSWSALAVVLLMLGTVAFAALHELQAQVEDHARDGALDTSRVITELVVQRNFDRRLMENGITAFARQDMDDDVSELKGTGRLVGLKLWRADGELMYTDVAVDASQVKPLTRLHRTLADGPQVDSTRIMSGRDPTLDVFLPYSSTHTRHHDGVVEILLPERPIAEAVRHDTRRLGLLVLVGLVVAATALLLLRRRLLAREDEARHDSLTGLLNRVALREDLGRTRDRLQPGTCAALLVLDLDGFKAVNDTLGHHAGDALLAQVGDALLASTRPGDRVARTGGDEFAVLLNDLPNEDTAIHVTGQLLDRLRRSPYRYEGVRLTVDASIGVALLPRHGTDIDELLQRADIAMYQAKKTHIGVAVYDESIDRHDVGELELLADLRAAIETDQLELHYQPKTRLSTGAVEGVEALVRWRHPERGLLSPAAFLPLAENTGLMEPLTEWVLRTAICQSGQWRKDGLLMPVAVNISPRSLLDADLPALVLRLLGDADIPADLLELEVTETGIMTDPDKAIDVLRRLRAMGVRTSIDDFGTGYTSLSYLKDLPVDTLKIDRAFIAQLMDSSKNHAITESIIALGHKLGLNVLAEGIETEEILQHLNEINCDEAQGYHIARPMPAEQATAWIHDRLDHLPMAAVSASRSR